MVSVDIDLDHVLHLEYDIHRDVCALTPQNQMDVFFVWYLANLFVASPQQMLPCFTHLLRRDAVLTSWKLCCRSRQTLTIDLQRALPHRTQSTTSVINTLSNIPAIFCTKSIHIHHTFRTRNARLGAQIVLQSCDHRIYDVSEIT